MTEHMTGGPAVASGPGVVHPVALATHAGARRMNGYRMKLRPIGCHQPRGLPRCLSFLLIVNLTVALFVLCAPSPAAAQGDTSHCHSAGLAFGKVGRERVEHFDDQHGHDVELWCVRGVFSAHYDLRIGWNDRAAPGAHRSMTIAGCFFNHGHNIGPELFADATGAYSKVEWINVSPPSENVTYRFSYDYASGMVTITMSDPCHQPISKVVAPQETFEQLDKMLPGPPSGSCPLKAPANSLPSGG
jgi:hypothetical protein